MAIFLCLYLARLGLQVRDHVLSGKIVTAEQYAVEEKCVGMLFCAAINSFLLIYRHTVL